MKVTVCILVALCVIAVCTARPGSGKGEKRGGGGQRGSGGQRGGGGQSGGGGQRGGRGHGGDPPHRHGDPTGEPSHRHGDATGEPPHRDGHHGKHDHTGSPPSVTTAADVDA